MPTNKFEQEVEYGSPEYHKNWLCHNVRKFGRSLGLSSMAGKVYQRAEFWYECSCGKYGYVIWKQKY